MKIFRLPDLGEGLPDAQIREWYVNVGDEVNVDQPLVAMETAKALVDVPAPLTGKIEKLFGQPGDSIETGQPLVGFEGESDETGEREDTGTVVGAIEAGEAIVTESASGIALSTGSTNTIKATPAVRALAKKLGINLTDITPPGPRITKADVENAVQKANAQPLAKGWKKQSSAQRAMVVSMSQSHQTVVPVTISDDANIHAWPKKTDITLRLIRAVQMACQHTPQLNAHYNDQQQAYYLNEHINVGLAIAMPHGLYVPVLKKVEQRDDADIRTQLNQFKQLAHNKAIPANALHGATIMLSNFGTFAGRYANPIVVPPCVAIVGVGKIREEVVPHQGQPAIHRILPLSVTFDHRPVTGSEAAQFLGTLIKTLQYPQNA